MTTRVDVVREARTWLGTKYAHQHREKGAAVDCAGVLTMTGAALSLSTFDVTDYSTYPEGMRLLTMCGEHMTRIPVADLKPADAVVLRIRRGPQHIGIVADYALGGLSMIHADSVIGRVVETPLDGRWMARVVAAYRIPGVEE